MVWWDLPSSFFSPNFFDSSQLFFTFPFADKDNFVLWVQIVSFFAFVRSIQPKFFWVGLPSLFQKRNDNDFLVLCSTMRRVQVPNPECQIVKHEFQNIMAKFYFFKGLAKSLEQPEIKEWLATTKDTLMGEKPGKLINFNLFINLNQIFFVKNLSFLYCKNKIKSCHLTLILFYRIIL